jgi:hypothetical protein
LEELKLDAGKISEKRGRGSFNLVSSSGIVG